jgi:hypothetical protein
MDEVDPLVGPLQNLSPTQPFRRNKIPSFGSFEDITWIGQGAMGVVYKAWEKRLKRHVALKMILAGSHAGEEQRARPQLRWSRPWPGPCITPTNAISSIATLSRPMFC